MSIPLLILIFIDMALFIVSSVFVCEFTMHMFQLNYYRYGELWRWFKRNAQLYIGHATVGVLMLIVVLIPWSPVVKASVLIPLFISACFMSKPKKAKKPLVHTNRVKRMDVTISIILLLICVLPLIRFYDRNQSYILFAISLTFFLSPLLVPIANLINKPIEYAGNRYYIRDAKRILADCPDLSIIGITGSFGKTSVKYFLTTLLRARYNTLMTPASFNTPLGIVKTVRTELKATDEIFVCEMGAKWVGDIKELCDLVHPKYGIITSIGPQHLESMGSLENIKKTKFELADCVIASGGLLFLNGDDENIKDFNLRKKYPAITYGFDEENDFYATDVSATNKGTTFVVHTPDGETEKYSTRLIGRHNVVNIIGAIAVCSSFGIPLSALKGQVRKLEGVPHRLELSERNGATIIDDAYNANPSGTRSALEALSYFDGFRIIVTPGMVELGDKQDLLNEEFGSNAAAVVDYAILVGHEQARPIKRGLLEVGFDEEKIFVAGSINEALSKAYSVNTGGKKRIILLENDLPDNY